MTWRLSSRKTEPVAGEVDNENQTEIAFGGRQCREVWLSPAELSVRV